MSVWRKGQIFLRDLCSDLPKHADEGRWLQNVPSPKLEVIRANAFTSSVSEAALLSQIYTVFVNIIFSLYFLKCKSILKTFLQLRKNILDTLENET